MSLETLLLASKMKKKFGLVYWIFEASAVLSKRFFFVHFTLQKLASFETYSKILLFLQNGIVLYSIVGFEAIPYKNTYRP